MKFDVAIIGGGFSGTMMAAQLARRGIGSVLIEGGGKLARGTAYSTREPAHLLNVKAAVMSAWPDDPDHFVRAVEAEGGSRNDYVERRRFGRYLGEQFAEAEASGRVRAIEAKAIRAERLPKGWRIELDNGETVLAEALVLAHGNQAPEPMRVTEGISPQRFVNNPWNADAKAAVDRLAAEGGDVLILGTGLTMIDMVLSLDSAGHQGRILALSRRGQIPRSHADFDPAPVEAGEVPHGNVLALWRWLRKRSAQLPWRAAVDSLRPHSQGLWQALPPAEQRRFLRHARPWWDVHRHRIAPEIGRRLKELVDEGRLEIAAGRVRAMREANQGLEVEIERRPSTTLRTSGTFVRTFATGFNCTGPLGTLSRTRDPILRQMLEEELLWTDALGIGIAVDGRSRVTASRNLWALGPLTKGQFWEMIAVPDIRGQVAQVADDIAKELCR
jgi:uncharacterized NAD(P)/FAD-binding protein YdhS